MKALTGFVCVLLFANGIIRHDVDIEQYRKLGSMPEFNSVGRYSSNIASNDYAAGVLIADRWVLTASHFIGDSSVWMFGGIHYRSKRTVRHPKLTAAQSELQWTGYDLALVELGVPVSNVTPAKRYSGRSEVGSTITKIGYGFVGDGVIGMKSPRVSERLGGQNIIDAAGGVFESRTFNSDVLVFDFDSPVSASANKLGDAEPIELEIGGSKGDSGGGVFAKFNGEWQLVGIVSGALNREIKYGSVAALARVSTANAWIDSVIGAQSTKK